MCENRYILYTRKEKEMMPTLWYICIYINIYVFIDRYKYKIFQRIGINQQNFKQNPKTISLCLFRIRCSNMTHGKHIIKDAIWPKFHLKNILASNYFPQNISSIYVPGEFWGCITPMQNLRKYRGKNLRNTDEEIEE